MKISAAWVAAGVLLLGGCGGGGGGGSGSNTTPTISLSSTSVMFTGVTGAPNGVQANQPQIDVTLKNGSGTYYGGVVSNDPYVKATFSTQSDTNGVIFLSMTGNPPPGQHSGTITFEVCGDTSCSNILSASQIPVTYNLYGFSNSQLQITASPNGSMVVGSATVEPAPPAGTFAVFSTQPWLSATLSGGTLSVNANPSALSQGTYFGTLKLTSALGEIDLSVTLLVGVTMSASSQTFVIGSDSTQGSLTGTLLVTFPSGSDQQYGYLATSNVNWITIPSPSNPAAEPLVFFINPSELGNLPNFTSITGIITLSSPGLADVQVPVTVTNKLAELYQVTSGPVHAGVAGQTITVSGRGFSALSSISAFQFSSGAGRASQGTILSDTEAVMTLPAALPQGTQQVIISNPENPQAVTQANFAALPAAGYPYTVLALTSGTGLQVAYDPSLPGVLALDSQTGHFSEIAPSGATLGQTLCALPGATGMVLSPDQSQVYLGNASGQIYAYGAYPPTCPSSQALLDTGLTTVAPVHQFASTSDDRIWVSGDANTNDFYYDIARGTTGSAELGGTQAFLLGSPDGAVLLSSLPNGTVLLYTTSNGAVSSLGNQPQIFSGTFTQDHSHLLANGTSVFAIGLASMTLSGTVPSETNFTNFGAVMSADGTRVYVLEGNPTTTVIDHISIYDSSVLDGSPFSLVGQIALPDKASDCTGLQNCVAAGSLTMDSFGYNLFWVGNKNLVVIPLTGTQQPVQHAFKPARLLPQAQAQR